MFQQTKTKDTQKTNYAKYINYTQTHTETHNTHTHFRMNTEFATNVHTFTGSIVDLLFEQFEGKVLGGDGDDVLTKEEIMKSLFGDYKPDDTVELAAPKEG